RRARIDLRLPARKFLRRRRAQHGIGISADVDRRCRHRGDGGRRGQFQRSGDMGCFALHVPRRVDAEYLWFRRRHAPHPHGRHHHLRHPGGWRQEGSSMTQAVKNSLPTFRTNIMSHFQSIYEIHDERFRRLTVGSSPLEELYSDCRWAEGPVWFADTQCLIFSDIPNERMLRWVPGGGISVFRSPSNFVNGNTRDRQGRLISCEHGGRRVVRTELDGSLTVLADQYRGKRLNSPN